MIKIEKYKYIALFASLVLVYGFVLAFTIVKTNEWRQAKSQEYLSKGKTTQNLSDRMLLFEKAAVLEPGEETYLNAGITALGLGNNSLAEQYLGRVKTAEGFYLLANAYYNLERYDLAARIYQQSIDKRSTSEAYIGLGKSHLKLGQVDKARNAFQQSSNIKKSKEVTDMLTLLADISVISEPDNRVITVYNALQKLGYPQSAETILQFARKKGYLNRDSLIMLAKEGIEHADYQAAYDYLTRAKVKDPYYPQIYQQLVVVSEKLGKTDEVKQYQSFYNNLVY